MELRWLLAWAFFAFLGCALAKSTFHWTKYQLKDNALKEKFICTESDFSSRYGHKLRIIRCSRGHPTAHIFTVGPAAGESSTYWIKRLGDMEKIYGTDFVLYAMDLRGSGGASRFTDTATDMSWTSSDFESLQTTDGKLEISELNLDGLSMDVEELVEGVKGEGGFTGTVHLHARSFGSQIAGRLMERDKKFFKSVLIESHLPSKKLFELQNDVGFLDLCAKDDFCRSQFGGMDPKLSRNIISSLSSAGYNECAVALMETLKKGDLGLLIHNQSDHLLLGEFLSPILHGKTEVEGSPHSALLVLPFLSAAYMCPDVGKFKNVILPAMVGLYKKQSVGRLESFEKGETEMNRAANAWLMSKEVFRMSSEDREQKHICHTPAPLGLSVPCVLYQHYYNYYKKMKKSLGRPSVSEEVFKHEGEIIFVGGALDLLCPLRPTMNAYESAEGSKKHLLAFNNLGHHPLGDSKCAKHIGAQLLGRGDAEAADGCVKEENSTKIKWSTIQPSWWAGSATGTTGSNNLEDKLSTATRDGKGFFSTWAWWEIILGVLMGTSIIAIIVGLAWYLGRRSVTANCSIIASP